jgi:hypothetical protein
MSLILPLLGIISLQINVPLDPWPQWNAEALARKGSFLRPKPATEISHAEDWRVADKNALQI